jgi:hypothetical protein
MILAAYTLLHVLISLVAILAGLIVVYDLITVKRSNFWISLFLWSTLLTSVTGFLFPFHKFLPSYVVGILSVIVLIPAFFAYYKRRLSGIWSRVFAITATIALYFNCFVLVVQCFKHIPPLQAIAPTQTEPPFKIAESIVLVIFLILGGAATWKSGSGSV